MDVSIEQYADRQYQPREASYEDTATVDTGNLSFYRYQNILFDLRDQPNWRAESDKCADYYDGNQIDLLTLSDLSDRVIPPLRHNLIKPNIDLLLGMEAKARTDFRVEGDTDAEQDAAEALTELLKQAERESRSNRACSDAYAGMAKSGVGWVEVVRNNSPFGYRYRASSVHRREMYWDWHANLTAYPLLEDARYVLRKRWFDADVIKTAFPQYADVITASMAGWDSAWLTRASENTGLAQALDIERGYSIPQSEWRNLARNRICLLEIWYRDFTQGTVMRMPYGGVVEVNLNDPRHIRMIESGSARPYRGSFSRLYVSIWAGPHKLSDMRAKDQSRLPYIPFWAFREDLTGVPYGPIRQMISAQDELNARRQKLAWLLSAKRVEMDSDALDTNYNTIQEMLAEVARPDAVVVLNPKRMNRGDAFQVQTDLGLSAQQAQMLEENKAAIQESAGIHKPTLGDAPGSQSGVAVNSLIEQDTTGLAEFNDNYVFARKAVGEALLDMIIEDIGDKPTEVFIEQFGGQKKKITLNMPAVDPETGQPTIVNDITGVTFKTALEDVPATPAYRTQLQNMLGQILTSAAPEVQAVLYPFYLESTDHPARYEMAKLIRQKMGMDDGSGDDPQTQALKQQVAQLQQALQQAQSGPQVQEIMAKVQNLAADTAKKQAETQRIALESELGQIDGGTPHTEIPPENGALNP